VNRHPQNASLALERRMREVDVSSQCADTIKLIFIKRSVTSEP
jgi:hypothetical protein